MSLSDRYNPQEVEQKTYQWWQERGYFKADDVSTKPPFSIILPPPNVTGSLHLGHALDHSIQDVLIRWKRMSGYNAMWTSVNHWRQLQHFIISCGYIFITECLYISYSRNYNYNAQWYIFPFLRESNFIVLVLIIAGQWV